MQASLTFKQHWKEIQLQKSMMYEVVLYLLMKDLDQKIVFTWKGRASYSAQAIELAEKEAVKPYDARKIKDVQVKSITQLSSK